MFIFFKFIITALIIVIVTEIAKFNDRIGGLIAALPITTFIILFWLHYEKNSIEKISNHASYTLLYVLPTLPMFLIFPYLLDRFSFWVTLLSSGLISVACFWLISLLVKYFGIDLV